MANNIYNGTFVLGNTSATTLSAGEGIKIDTSVPGIIGISNDETVLWSGYVKMENDATITASEPLSGFEKIDFYMEGYADNLRVPQVLTFSGSNREFNLSPLGYMGNAIRLNHIRLNFNNLVGTFSQTLQYLLNENGTLTTGNDRPYINKIVGINRIGGNE